MELQQRVKIDEDLIFEMGNEPEDCGRRRAREPSAGRGGWIINLCKFPYTTWLS